VYSLALLKKLNHRGTEKQMVLNSVFSVLSVVNAFLFEMTNVIQHLQRFDIKAGVPGT